MTRKRLGDLTESQKTLDAGEKLKEYQREWKRKQRLNPKFRALESARSRAYYAKRKKDKAWIAKRTAYKLLWNKKNMDLFRLISRNSNKKWHAKNPHKQKEYATRAYSKLGKEYYREYRKRINPTVGLLDELRKVKRGGSTEELIEAFGRALIQYGKRGYFEGS